MIRATGTSIQGGVMAEIPNPIVHKHGQVWWEEYAGHPGQNLFYFVPERAKATLLSEARALLSSVELPFFGAIGFHGKFTNALAFEGTATATHYELEVQP